MNARPPTHQFAGTPFNRGSVEQTRIPCKWNRYLSAVHKLDDQFVLGDVHLQSSRILLKGCRKTHSKSSQSRPRFLEPVSPRHAVLLRRTQRLPPSSWEVRIQNTADCGHYGTYSRFVRLEWSRLPISWLGKENADVNHGGRLGWGATAETEERINPALVFASSPARVVRHIGRCDRGICAKPVVPPASAHSV